ncbi:hypothetical protein HPSH_06435 [Helicobacter pylori Shi470]|nr:hypothetical protein HPSH_06435 [Helicobacter pylori Shi470]
MALCKTPFLGDFFKAFLFKVFLNPLFFWGGLIFFFADFSLTPQKRFLIFKFLFLERV